MGKFIPKIPFLVILILSPHFKSHNGEIWRKGADPGLPSPTPNFV